MYFTREGVFIVHNSYVWAWDFLETVLPTMLEDVSLALRQRLWFQNDGAPAHYGEDVRQ
jgi:hypothetical protein